MWLYRHTNRQEKAMKLYEDLKNSIKEDNPKRKYFFRQIEQALNIKDNSEFLLDNKNIVASDIHEVYKLFEGYFMDEIAINQLLCQGDETVE